MWKFLAIRAVALLAPVALALGGCVPLIAGAGGAAAVGASQDRGLEQAVDDNEIAFEINRKLLAGHSSLYSGVSTQVRKGRVLLTGRVPAQEDRIAVTRLVWSIGGVKEVINELHVGKEGSFPQSVNDTTISTKLRGRLVGDSNVSGINYSIETVDGVVYLMGTARDIKGVRNVVSYVDVKNRG
jgi:osmotically-inducible protein OsmY